MNIISVEHLPPLTLITNSQSKTNRSKTLHPDRQARNTPPPTIVSEGKAVKGIGVGVKAIPLTIVSKGKAVTGNVFEGQTPRKAQNVPPLTIVSKGKAVTNTGVGARALPLTIVSRGKASEDIGIKPSHKGPPVRNAINANFNKAKVGNAKTSDTKGEIIQPAVASSSKGPLCLKRYDPVSAPEPFFGRFKSRIPLKTTMRAYEGDDLSHRRELEMINTTITEVPESLIDADLVRGDIDVSGVECQYFPPTASNINQENSAIGGDQCTIIIETADKAVQTDCFCQCYSGGSNDLNLKKILEEMGSISTEMRDLKLNITGKTVVKKIQELFPIKSEADLVKIDHNIENTPKFEMRLRLYLKYLKPKSSSVISTAFKELIDDGLLKGRNWDGSNKMLPLNKFKFFETNLFDAWKNSIFTKNVYISAMKEEIKRSHDREGKRGK